MYPTGKDCTPIPQHGSLPPRRIIRTMEAMRFQKDLYDLHYPEHWKKLSVTDLWRIAHRKLVEELSIPFHVG